MTKQSVANAKKTSSLSEKAKASTDRGVKGMRRLSQAIDRIKASSDATAKSLMTIDKIVYQTNLLGLNAAVEAARPAVSGEVHIDDCVLKLIKTTNQDRLLGLVCEE